VADDSLVRAFGEPMVRCLLQVKRSEVERHAQATDKDEWQRREYFSRF
jgi:glutamine synthetase